MNKLKKVMKKLKIILIVIGVLITIVGLLVGYFIVCDLKQEELLKQEIINYSNKNLTTDNYDITVKTTGDYAYVEEAIKKYFKKLSDEVKNVNSYLNSDRLNKLLTLENLKTDSPDYSISHNTIKDARTNINNGIIEIKQLCEEEKIKNLLDKNKLTNPKYYYNFYIKLMYTDSDKENFTKLNKEMDSLSLNINAFFDKIDEILIFLEKNTSIIEYRENTMHFSSEQTLSEYKKHLSELDEVSRKIKKEEKQKTTDSL